MIQKHTNSICHRDTEKSNHALTSLASSTTRSWSLFSPSLAYSNKKTHCDRILRIRILLSFYFNFKKNDTTGFKNILTITIPDTALLTWQSFSSFFIFLCSVSGGLLALYFSRSAGDIEFLCNKKKRLIACLCVFNSFRPIN